MSPPVTQQTNNHHHHHKNPSAVTVVWFVSLIGLKEEREERVECVLTGELRKEEGNVDHGDCGPLQAHSDYGTFLPGKITAVSLTGVQ